MQNKESRQRGINGEIVDIILNEADKENYCKLNGHSMYVSKRKLLTY